MTTLLVFVVCLLIVALMIEVDRQDDDGDWWM